MILALALLAASCATAGSKPDGVHLVTDEADSVLNILALEEKGQTVPDQDWKALSATDGYVRLKARELGMKRKFEDDDFKKFVQSKELVSQRMHLSKALADWEKTDVTECQKRALAYLPKGADIAAKVYILIKPLHNSFVWEVEKDPAIMLYLDPTESHEAFSGTVAHEMHHIGYGRSCPTQDFNKWLAARPTSLQTAFMWVGAFGEGYAVLAAAGGPGTDPQAWAQEDVRADWKKGMTHQREQFAEVQDFLLKVCQGKLTDDQILDGARSFYGIVGPWYTVGYTMATTIEAADGRAKLLACYEDPRLVLPTYNQAARKLNRGLPLWSPELLKALK